MTPPTRGEAGAAEAAGLPRVERAAAEAELAWLRVRLEELQTGLGHDLRSPLAILSGHSQLLEAGAVPPAQLARTATTLRKQVDRLNLMLDEELSRLRAFPPTARDAPGPLVDAAIATVRPFLLHRQVSVHVEGEQPVAGVGSRVAVLLLALVLEGMAIVSPPGATIVVRVAGPHRFSVVRRSEEPPVSSRNAAEAVWAIAARLAAEVGAILELGTVEMDLLLPSQPGGGVPPEGRDPVTGLPVLGFAALSLPAPFGPAPAVLLELADPDALVRDCGPDAVQDALAWLSRVVYRVFGGQPFPARLPGPRILVRRPLGDDTPGDEWSERVTARLYVLESALAAARPRLGGHRIRVAVRSSIFDLSTLEAAADLGQRIQGWEARNGS